MAFLWQIIVISSSAQVRGEQFGQICNETMYTFFVDTFNNGKCWMKWGDVTKDDAIIKTDRVGACGII